MRGNIRDPLVARLIGPGKAFELETVGVGGHEHEVFAQPGRAVPARHRR